MRIDGKLPEYDATSIHEVVVDAEPARVWLLILETDLALAAHRSRAVHALLAMRAAPSRLARRLRHQSAPEVDSLKLSSLPELGEWVVLDEDFGHEIVFGGIGRVRAREVEWRLSESHTWDGFSSSGWTKVAASLAIRTDEDGRTLLSYEIRAHALDSDSRRKLAVYWRFARPFLAIVQRGLLNYVRQESEGAYVHEMTPPPSRYGGRARAGRH
ncbi:hypothetical protein HJD18_04800 [Thermoleophilia bacterium SCSIO 60948]|nr:hypothetical protein HJD18_04800 [Thermoleophilia bacterium SCSIO 60948]